ncbi:ubiquitin carboxyl-terminal hydrolase 13 isoform X3 [Pseudoliparis swirei]|uniref:ubiquitin carboxyl-terminal hydrolase 13 isoform X3 n=1 Tax=Pseudoliparis swirei TaxID=2059687 RepID=UPI0024BDF4E9|nr:ubiquitin carboxyl-terminal hydrolase 13 isoform X3 [Pseudoliparis swirei]
MAVDLGELLVPYMPTVRVPRTGDRVFKSECAFSFDSPESEGGLYVCMNTFLGFGREHVERHYRKTGQSVYMHLKRHVKAKATGAAGGAIPRRRNGKVFLDLELNRDFNGQDYEYEDEAKLVIFPDHFEIPLPNIEELPALVTIACDAALNAPSAYKKQEPESWEEEIQVSRHARSLRQLDNGVRIPPSGWKCQKCVMRENLWLNLTDGAVLCGKWFFDGSGGNGHALDHYKETKYPLAVKIETITPDGADVYSFEEEEAVLDPHISEHLSHFGIDKLQMQKKTENGHHTENNSRPRVSEWEVIQESGMKLKAVFGSGYTGIKNLGNSCYLGTVMQVLFSIPDFQRMYVGNLQRIFDYSPLDPSQDFATQMAKLGHGLLSGQHSKPPMKSELIEQVMKEESKVLNWHQQKGVPPRMLKALVGRGHPEFSSNRQQDAHEFLLHIINMVERNSAGLENPSDIFRFLVEERVQCCQTRQVRYSQRVDYCIQLPAPIEAATNREELMAYETKRRDAEENMQAPPEPVRARIPFTACLQAFTEPENVPDFWSSALQAKSAAVKTSRFASFPEYLVLQIKKFTFGVDWVPKKLDLAIDVPDFLDLSRLRAIGLQASEEELPDLLPPIMLAEDTRDNSMSSIDSPEIDEAAVMQLAEMGFPLEACRKAVYYTGNMGTEMAFNWIIAHMEEPDFAEPLTLPSIMDPGPSTSDSPVSATLLSNLPPEESIAILTSMGFPRAHSIQALKATVAARISACLTDISQWMSAHHLKINPDKTELLFLPGKGSPTHDLTTTFNSSVLAPTPTARNLGVTLDSQLSLTANITATERSCRYMLHNIRRIRPLLTQKAAQVLIQALVISRLDYCNSLLAGLPAKAIRPLQLIQNAAARLVFSLPKFTHTTPLLRSLHWLPVAARIRFKTLVLAYHALNGSGPVSIRDMVTPYTPARSLRSATANRLVTPAPRANHSKSRLFAVLAPQWWKGLPTDIRTAESLYIFRRRLKTHLFRLYLD